MRSVFYARQGILVDEQRFTASNRGLLLGAISSSLSLPGPEDIVHTTLENGLRVFVRENHSSPSVVLAGYLPGGANHESPERAGLAAFTASMLMRGTSNRTFEEINEAIESVGASLSVHSGRHVLSISGKCLAEDYGLLVEVLADVLQNPIFPDEQVERVRGQRLTSLQERDNDTRAVAGLLFRRLAYPEGHPYSRPVEGFQETIGSLRRKDLVDFYQQTYGTQGGVLVVVGAVKAADAIAQIEDRLAGWHKEPGTSNAWPEVRLPVSLVREERVLAGKTQSDIVLGVPALRRADPDYYAALVANTVLGRFGMMGRLGENVRERLGLAYYSYSTLEANKEPGPWMVIAGVNPANVERCLKAVNEELQRLGSELVPEEELSDSKAYLTGSLPLRLETNEGVAQSILDMAWYELGLDYLLRFRDLINSVTAEQVRAVAARYLRPQAYALAIAGPARDVTES